MIGGGNIFRGVQVEGEGLEKKGKKKMSESGTYTRAFFIVKLFLEAK
ncbi:hypothetical protein N9Y89_01700 [bacterium]|nr:hypothetical protein [bacterium]